MGSRDVILRLPLGRVKHISMRLVRPTIPRIDVELFLTFCHDWRDEYEMGEVKVHDEGTGQYLLIDESSHHIYYAGLVLGKSSLFATLIQTEPEDKVEDAGGFLALSRTAESLSGYDQNSLLKLLNILRKKGYRFSVSS